MSDSLPDEWIEDDPEEEEEPDFSGICSDPVGVIEDQFLRTIETFRAEGYSHCEIMAALTLATADLAQQRLP